MSKECARACPYSRLFTNRRVCRRLKEVCVYARQASHMRGALGPPWGELETKAVVSVVAASGAKAGGRSGARLFTLRLEAA